MVVVNPRIPKSPQTGNPDFEFSGVQYRATTDDAGGRWVEGDKLNEIRVNNGTTESNVYQVAGKDTNATYAWTTLDFAELEVVTASTVATVTKFAYPSFSIQTVADSVGGISASFADMVATAGKTIEADVKGLTIVPILQSADDGFFFATGGESATTLSPSTAGTLSFDTREEIDALKIMGTSAITNNVVSLYVTLYRLPN